MRLIATTQKMYSRTLSHRGQNNRNKSLEIFKPRREESSTRTCNLGKPYTPRPSTDCRTIRNLSFKNFPRKSTRKRSVDILLQACRSDTRPKYRKSRFYEHFDIKGDMKDLAKKVGAARNFEDMTLHLGQLRSATTCDYSEVGGSCEMKPRGKY